MLIFTIISLAVFSIPCFIYLISFIFRVDFIVGIMQEIFGVLLLLGIAGIVISVFYWIHQLLKFIYS